MAIIDSGIAQAILDKMSHERVAGAAAVANGTDYYTLLTASDDPSVELVIGPAAVAQDTRNANQDLIANRHTGLLNALVQHLQKAPDTGETKAIYQTLGAYLAAAAYRVHIAISEIHAEAFSSLGYLAPALVYDAVKELGSFACSGENAGTFTDGVALDAVNTGGNNLEAYVEEGVTATNIALNVTCVLPGGGTEVKSITVDVALDDTVRSVAIGDSSDLYTNISLVAITGGGAATEVVKFRSALDRPLAL